MLRISLLTACILLTIGVSVLIVAWGMTALFQIRRHRLYRTIDRIQQFMVVGKLASGDPNFGVTLVLSLRNPQMSSGTNFLIDSLYTPHERNIIEAMLFYEMHPNFTAAEAIGMVFNELEFHSKRSGWLSWL